MVTTKPTFQKLRCPHLWMFIRQEAQGEVYCCQMCLMWVRVMRDENGDFDEYEVLRSQAKIGG